MTENKGFDPQTIEEYRARIEAGGMLYVEDEEDERSDEYCHFYFLGKFEGKDVVYDTVMYTLRLEHESELHEIAERRAAAQFPDYHRVMDAASEEEEPSEREEEIGMFMAEIIMELEEEGTVKVREHVDIDTDADFGIALDVGLHRPRLTQQEIEQFIRAFNEGNLKLDDRLYSFETESFTD
jgi:hypothetical protein